MNTEELDAFFAKAEDVLSWDPSPWEDAMVTHFDENPKPERPKTSIWINSIARAFDVPVSFFVPFFVPYSDAVRQRADAEVRHAPVLLPHYRAQVHVVSAEEANSRWLDLGDYYVDERCFDPDCGAHAGGFGGDCIQDEVIQLSGYSIENGLVTYDFIRHETCDETPFQRAMRVRRERRNHGPESHIGRDGRHHRQVLR